MTRAMHLARLNSRKLEGPLDLAWVYDWMYEGRTLGAESVRAICLALAKWATTQVPEADPLSQIIEESETVCRTKRYLTSKEADQKIKHFKSGKRLSALPSTREEVARSCGIALIASLVEEPHSASILGSFMLIRQDLLGLSAEQLAELIANALTACQPSGDG